MGSMPECEADMLLKVMPVTQPVKPKLLREDSPSEIRKTPKSTTDAGKSRCLESNFVGLLNYFIIEINFCQTN